jgi:hypothetical protein
VVLIDGERFVNLMIKYEVGTQVVSTYNVIDLDETISSRHRGPIAVPRFSGLWGRGVAEQGRGKNLPFMVMSAG